MFDKKYKKELKVKIEELKDQIEDIQCELAGKDRDAIYIAGDPISMKEKLDQIIRYLDIEFVWVWGEGNHYEVRKIRKTRVRKAGIKKKRGKKGGGEKQ